MIGFQGTLGAHSESAAKSLSSLVRASSISAFDSIDQIDNAIQRKDLSHIVLPLESSSTGTFIPVYDLIARHSLFIVGELHVKESQALLALPGVRLEDITEIKSHPFAIDQCRNFIASIDKKVTIAQAADTAASAKLIAENNLRSTAAIASKEAAKLYNLNILADAIQDDKTAITRYVLLGTQLTPVERHLNPKTSLSFTVKNTVGAFHKALACFALRDINVTKIETRPSSRTISLGSPWEYVMYMDIDGSINERHVDSAIQNLKEFATVRVIGCYPRHQPAYEPNAVQWGFGM